MTTALALRWATAPADATPATKASRLDDVRRFAVWLSATDPRTEIPPRGLLPDRYRRRPPYIYSDKEIESIVREAAQLRSVSGLRGQTYATLYGLLAATGLRLSEALALDRDDVDLHAGVLAVRRTKFGKSRFVPVHDSTRRRCSTMLTRGIISLHAAPLQPSSSPRAARASRSAAPGTTS